MRVIPTRVHGVVDYMVGILLIAAPWLLGFARNGAETWTPVFLGAGTILYSLFTNYEWGVKKSISMNTHLGLDLMSGIVLAVSPWLFGFSDYVYLPHLLVGIGEIGITLMSERNPYSRSRTTHSQSAP